ncbi:MAG: hypothetical protein PHZ11_00665 [Desulfitobacteriaceae bacterium]|nr:hypothetical protein [Desulfitobacteriaceae bacterium]MDD4345407.1 hypothetical protein [Desulfitobacteriaceae bacterium]MDD4402102.1 hypothetical protein [Desulfitobacteriaceae bacterium]
MAHFLPFAEEDHLQANQCTRASILRQLAISIENTGAFAYVVPKGYYPTEEQYVRTSNFKLDAGSRS